MRSAALLLAPLVGACAQEIIVFPDAAVAADAALVDVGPDAVDSGAGIDAAAGLDARPDDAAGLDGGPGDASEPACTGDRFDPCDDPSEAGDPNDSWSDASRYHSTSVGCIQGDDLSMLQGSRAGVMCPLEDADYYALTVVPCDTLTLRMQVRLRMRDACPAEAYALRLLYGGGERDCGELFDGEPIECLEEGADRIIRLVIPPSRTVQSWYFAVLAERPDVTFEYDLEVSVQ